MRKIYRDLILLLLFFAGVWAISAIYFANKDPVDLPVLNKHQKEQLAIYLDEQFRKGRILNEDPVVDSAVLIIMDRLQENTTDTVPFKILILESEDVNAFATLEGRIYVFTGLIKKCENPEMLAAVLAHEMGHIDHEHLIERLTNEIGFSLLLAVLTGGDPVMVSELGKTALSMHFNREQEREADDFGRSLLLNSNIDPIRFAQFMMIMKTNQLEHNTISFINTHPEMEERILSTTALKVPDGFKEESFNLDWERVKRALDNEI
ncbi:MAG: M48 family metallopeptidase [Candidatus Cyclobacteriaceae bacterium M2_1C_046]